ncbi:glycoside hydrolase family 64 protein [Streptomyces asiaticus]
MPPTALPPLRRRGPARLAAAATLALATFCSLGAMPSAAADTDGRDSHNGHYSARAEGQPPDDFWGDTSTIPPAKNVLTVKILNRTNGKYPDDQVFWTFNNETHSIAEQPTLDMPANSAGRMYFHLGSPDSKYSDFIEFTVGDDVFNGNTTRVDAFALKLAMRLHAHDGFDTQVGEDYETFQEDRDATWKKFADAMPAEFASLSEVEKPYRILAPGSVPDFREGGKYADYMSGYAKTIGIDAPTSDIFGCAGVLANEAGKCSALNRHVAQLPEDQWSDPGQYYKDAPANYYAKFWHDHAIDKLAYGFPYDDFAGQSSFVSHNDPQWLEVAVGW